MRQALKEVSVFILSSTCLHAMFTSMTSRNRKLIYNFTNICYLSDQLSLYFTLKMDSMYITTYPMLPVITLQYTFCPLSHNLVPVLWQLTDENSVCKKTVIRQSFILSNSLPYSCFISLDILSRTNVHHLGTLSS